MFRHFLCISTVKEMATQAGVSLSHFTTLFKKEMEMVPTAYLKHNRLESARHLLETIHERIKQIAVRVGMSEKSHFTRDFKTKYGLSPTKYRRQFQEKRQAERKNGKKS